MEPKLKRSVAGAELPGREMPYADAGLPDRLRLRDEEALPGVTGSGADIGGPGLAVP